MTRASNTPKTGTTPWVTLNWPDTKRDTTEQVSKNRTIKTNPATMKVTSTAITTKVKKNIEPTGRLIHASSGNHALGQNYDDRYGANVGSRLNGGHKLNEFEARQHGNDGYEGNGKLIALNQGVKDYYGKNGYYNSGNKYGALGGGQSQNYGKYGLQNGYHNGFNNGRSFEDFRGGKFGAGIGGYGPYGY